MKTRYNINAETYQTGKNKYISIFSKWGKKVVHEIVYHLNSGRITYYGRNTRDYPSIEEALKYFYKANKSHRYSLFKWTSN